jgi:fumarylacetoacetate (FAA) hydrolase
MKLVHCHAIGSRRFRVPEPGVVVDGFVYDWQAVARTGGLGPNPSHHVAAHLCEAWQTGRAAQVEEELRALGDSLADHRLPLAEVELAPPVRPESFRDFYAFERHVVNARKNRGLEMVREWYEAPVFYFSNTAGIVGHRAPVRKPPETNELDYELELGVVIGRDGRDIPVAEAHGHIAGFTIINDWSARDLQRREMKVGLGPAKGKDFATSLGPWLVTPDELRERALPEERRGMRYDLTMVARVNGRECSRGNAREMHWTFAELIAQASRNTVLRPGDLIGSGTVGTGCITEFPKGTYPWLQPGDVVELEIDALGILENEVVS